MDALSKIGGYYSALFALITILALYLNRLSFNRDLQRAFKNEVGEIRVKTAANADGYKSVEDEKKVHSHIIK
jgi:hypothetical protein